MSSISKAIKINDQYFSTAHDAAIYWSGQVCMNAGIRWNRACKVMPEYKESGIWHLPEPRMGLVQFNRCYRRSLPIFQKLLP